MTDYPRNTREERVMRLGDWHSYWIPGNPKDGEFWGITHAEHGSMPVNFSHKRSPRGKYLEGGPWLQVKHSYTNESSPRGVYTSGGQLAYNGRMDVPNTWGTTIFNRQTEDVYTDAYALGVEAYKRMRPDKPDFNAALALLEIKDVLPGLAKKTSDIAFRVRKALKAKGLKPKKLPPVKNLPKKKWYEILQDDGRQTAEYHLAVQFGWLPLLSDICSAVTTYFTNEEKVRQLIRDAGKPVRRSGVLLQDSGVSSEGVWLQVGAYANSQMSPVFVTSCYNYGDWPTSAWHESWNRRVWFSGKSRYYLPTLPDGRVDALEVMKRAGGLTWITPSNMYNLIPWSWAVDYFTGLGDFIEATDPGIADTWIIDYAYIMDQRQTVHKNIMEVGLHGAGGSTFRHRVTRTRNETFKTRVPASIFGWGLSQNDLSPKQLGILGAIGVSRL